MKNSKESSKPMPTVGMAVIWEDECVLNQGDANYLTRMMLEKRGEGPFRIHSVQENVGDTNPIGMWSVTLKKDDLLIINDDPDYGPLNEPIYYNWLWLRPIPQTKLQIGAVVTWQDVSRINRPFKGWPPEEIIQSLIAEHGTGPFIVAIQEGEAVKLIDCSGELLMHRESPKFSNIHRCFLKEA